jgi:hypothetical protein
LEKLEIMEMKLTQPLRTLNGVWLSSASLTCSQYIIHNTCILFTIWMTCLHKLEIMEMEITIENNHVTVHNWITTQPI